eukprot:364861-Chlamydomonas_euryale.AAC.8
MDVRELLLFATRPPSTIGAQRVLSTCSLDTRLARHAAFSVRLSYGSEVFIPNVHTPSSPPVLPPYLADVTQRQLQRHALINGEHEGAIVYGESPPIVPSNRHGQVLYLLAKLVLAYVTQRIKVLQPVEISREVHRCMFVCQRMSKHECLGACMLECMHGRLPASMHACEVVHA